MNYEQNLTIEELAHYTNGDCAEMKHYMDLGFLPIASAGSLAEPLFYPNAVEVVRFVRKVGSLGFRVDEIRTMLLLVDLFGGANDYIATAVDEKLTSIREKVSELIKKERELASFESQCRKNRSFLARLATRPTFIGESVVA